MCILILFFILLHLVLSYGEGFSTHLTQPYGFIRAPNFQKSYSTEVCEWVLDLGYYNVLEIRIESINLTFGDLIYIRDGLHFNSPILVKFYGLSGYRKFTTSSGSAVIYFLKGKNVSNMKKSQFNITYQIKGRCIPGIQAPCSEEELNCFDLRYEQCDSIWNCPLSGKDEENCSSCLEMEFIKEKDRYPCSEFFNSRCYSKHQRCDGIQDCQSLADEMNCDPIQCGVHNKTFLCSSFPTQCIVESLRCDGTFNCKDGSDENNCVKNMSYYESGHFKVIIVSSLSALIFLVMIAMILMCLCRLRMVRVESLRQTHGGRGHISHNDTTIERLIEEEMLRRSAPPNYINAIRYSRPFSSISDLNTEVRSYKKHRTHLKPRRHRSRRLHRSNSNSDNCQLNTNENNLVNEDDGCPKEFDTRLLVPEATDGELMSDSELIDPGTGEPNQQEAFMVL